VQFLACAYQSFHEMPFVSRVLCSSFFIYTRWSAFIGISTGKVGGPASLDERAIKTNCGNTDGAGTVRELGLFRVGPA
jgi:hypothetical protein